MTPSPRQIGRGLGAATECFAGELAQPREVAPAWSPFGWQMAEAAAVLHGVTPLLAGALRWTGPERWQSFMAEQRHQTLLRYRRIEAALNDVDERATATGLAAVALKGAALHAMGVYRPGERPMSDIDLLVREADGERAAQLLVALGYVQTGAIWKHRIFEHARTASEARAWRASLSTVPLGEHVNHPVKIELHTQIAEKLPFSAVPITDQVFPRHAHPGLNPYPCANALLLHLLLHAAGNMCGRQLRLMHLHDLARLAARMGADDWHELLGMLPLRRAPWWALPPLEMLNHYHPALAPVEVLEALRATTPWSLRRQCRRWTLSRVSLAAVQIPAFPGLAWCTSHAERLRYMRDRIFPGAQQQASRRHLATEEWAIQPSWTHLSQGHRILRWVLQRPIRPASLYIARAALAQRST